MTGRILATLSPSPPRRVIGTALLGVLGGFLLWVAAANAPAPGWRAFLVAAGLGAVWMGLRLWRATRVRLILTEEALADSEGRVLAPLDTIERIERGAFAVKPASGFTLRLSARLGGAWAPGLWWRLGRHVGVGGVTGSAEARVMAEILSERLSQRP